MFVPNVKMQATALKGERSSFGNRNSGTRKIEDTEEWYWYCVKSKCCINLAIMYT